MRRRPLSLRVWLGKWLCCGTVVVRMIMQGITSFWILTAREQVYFEAIQDSGAPLHKTELSPQLVHCSISLYSKEVLYHQKHHHCLLPFKASASTCTSFFLLVYYVQLCANFFFGRMIQRRSPVDHFSTAPSLLSCTPAYHFTTPMLTPMLDAHAEAHAEAHAVEGRWITNHTCSFSNGRWLSATSVS